MPSLKKMEKVSLKLTTNRRLLMSLLITFYLKSKLKSLLPKLNLNLNLSLLLKKGSLNLSLKRHLK